MPSQEVTKNAQKGPMYTRVATLVSRFPSENLSKVLLNAGLGGYSQTSASLTGVAANASLKFTGSPNGDVKQKKKASELTGLMNVSHNFNTTSSNAEGGASTYQTSLKLSNKKGTPDLIMGTQVDVIDEEVPTKIKKWLNMHAGDSGKHENQPIGAVDYQFGLVNATTFSCFENTQCWAALDRNTGKFKSVYVRLG